MLQSSLASAERVVKVLDLDQVTDDAYETREKLESMESIEFKNIFFSYNRHGRSMVPALDVTKDESHLMPNSLNDFHINDDEPVLKNISFSIAKGESVGIVGHTGSGKSSVINLVSGFYKQNSGQILINSMDYEEFSLGDIRSRIALVMQEPMLFSGSIRENIMLPGGDVEDIVFEEALVNANCSFLWDRYKTGLDTMVYEGGRPLSSGEKQLVCIARAFAFDPDLIIFDEATSYMDSQSEQQVHGAMKKLMKNRMSIIIAHRLSTVKEGDRIMLFKNGEISESGTNEELLMLKGDYFNFVEKEKIGLKI